MGAGEGASAATRTALGAGLSPRFSPGAWLLVGMFVALVSTPLTAGSQEAAHELKAQFVERFTRFVEWPEGSGVGRPGAPFTVGVIGDEPLREALEGLARRVRIKGQKVDVVRLDGMEEALRCQVVFLSSSRSADVGLLAEITKDRPILTVGDGDGFASRGVLINFYQDGKFLRFEINAPAMRAAGLRVAADLLAVARVVGE